MPPLHIAVVEVHKEYTQMNMEAKDMAKAYKVATSVGDQLQK